MNKIPLVAYSVNNMYFMGIQAGIQAAHSLVELVSICNKNDHLCTRTVGNLEFRCKELAEDWVTNHKTMSVLNGGSKGFMEENACIIERSSFPSARFYESDCADNCLSSISVICPNVKEIMKRKYLHKFISDADFCMFELLASLRFAS